MISEKAFRLSQKVGEGGGGWGGWNGPDDLPLVRGPYNIIAKLITKAKATAVIEN